MRSPRVSTWVRTLGRRRPPCEAPDPLPGQRPALRAQIAGKEFRAGPRGRRGRGRRRAEPAAATQRLRDGTGRTRGTRVHQAGAQACGRLVACNQDRGAENWSSVCRPPRTALSPFLSPAGASALHRK